MQPKRANKRERDDRVSEVLVQRVVEGAIRSGRLDPLGKTESELRQEAAVLLKQIANDEQAVFEFVIDYTATLLKEARRAHREGHDEIAVILYATWIEHFLNQVVLNGTARKGLPAADGYQMLREINLKSKATWLLPLVGLRRISEAHVNVLVRLSETRNQYVHYKWKGIDEDEPHDAKRLESLIEDAEKTITYLRRYERSVVFGDRKRATVLRTP
jgi:hypothetical protein